MKVLVACEESQAVCKAFRQLGHEAYSCDLLPCSGGHPEWHLQGDAIKVLKGGAIEEALPYVTGAYECAFPDDDQNSYVAGLLRTLLTKYNSK